MQEQKPKYTARISTESYSDFKNGLRFILDISKNLELEENQICIYLGRKKEKIVRITQDTEKHYKKIFELTENIGGSVKRGLEATLKTEIQRI